MWFPSKFLLTVLSNFNFALGAKQNFEVHYLSTSFKKFGAFVQLVPIPYINAATSHLTKRNTELFTLGKGKLANMRACPWFMEGK